MIDLSLPGYKYLGPGNSLNKGNPTSYNDFVALIHDIEYGEIIQQGGNPYLQWSQADADAYNRFTSGDYGGRLGRVFFGLKKLAHDVGIISKFDSNMSGQKRRHSDDDQANKRLRENNQLTVYDDMTDVESGYSDDIVPYTPPDEPEAKAASMSVTGGTKGQRETPVSIPPTISYGLPNTHTCWLPMTFWVSAYGYSHETAANLVLRLDSPVQPIVTTLGTDTSSAGFKNFQIKPDNGALIGPSGAEQGFPVRLSTSPTLQPMWYNYFANLYEYYTVLGCSYKIFIQAASQNSKSMTHVFKHIQSEGEAGTTSGIKNTTKYWELINYPEPEWRVLYSHNNPNGKAYEKSFEGYYQRGKASRNVRNDEDVKTWTKTDGSKPALREELKIGVFQHPFDINSTNQCGVNVQVTLNYKVQFKDIVNHARYPTSTQGSSVVNSLPTDVNTIY